MAFTLRYRNRILSYRHRIDEITASIRSFDQSAIRVLSHLYYCINKPLDLSNQACLVFGTGNFLNEAVTLKLLGSSSVKTFDISNLINNEACLKAIANNKMFLRSMEPFIASDLRQNFKRLQKATATELSSFVEAGIEIIVDKEGISKASIPRSSIDLIYSYNVFEHIPLTQQPKIWQEFAKILKPGGKIIIYVDYSNHFNPINKPFEHLGMSNLDPSEQGLGFSHKQFIDQIENTGLQISKLDVSSDSLAWPPILQQKQLDLSNYNGETSALLMVEHE